MTSYAPADVPALDRNQSIIEYLKRSLPKENLETFRKFLESKNNRFPKEHNEHYEIQEIKPPRDNIAYSCNYKMYVPILSGGLPVASGSFVYIEQYWDKDGNCIGFKFNRQTFMLQDNEYKVPENSELSKFLGQHPGAHVEEKDNKFFVTYIGIIPCDITVRREAIFDKDGKFISVSPVPKHIDFKSGQSKISTKSKAKTLRRIATVDKEH